MKIYVATVEAFKRKDYLQNKFFVTACKKLLEAKHLKASSNIMQN